MFRIKDGVDVRTLGFEEKNFDYVRYVLVDGIKRIGFTIYKGSPYLRYSKASYVMEEQLKLIYEWSKQDVLEWENV